MGLIRAARLVIPNVSTKEAIRSCAFRIRQPPHHPQQAIAPPTNFTSGRPKLHHACHPSHPRNLSQILLPSNPPAIVPCNPSCDPTQSIKHSRTRDGEFFPSFSAYPFCGLSPEFAAAEEDFCSCRVRESAGRETDWCLQIWGVQVLAGGVEVLWSLEVVWGGSDHRQTMPFIDGVGDELLYTALVVAPVVFLCRSSLGQSLSFLKQGVSVVRLWIGSLWGGSVATREPLGGRGDLAPPLERTTSSSTFAARHMDSPPDNDCCSVCHDSFTLPCQANCAHWFCGECILRVWQHSSVLQPCKCPICRRAITLLIPTEISEDQQNEPEVERIMRDLAKYNRIFGGGPVSFMQRVRDMPLLLRRMVGELMDPQRAIPLVHRTRILFFLVLLAVYVFSPLDVIPEGVLGLVGLLDDLLVIIMVLFYLAMLYRSTLVLHHGGLPQ